MIMKWENLLDKSINEAPRQEDVWGEGGEA
jgi:hypothetical protein